MILLFLAWLDKRYEEDNSRERVRALAGPLAEVIFFLATVAAGPILDAKKSQAQDMASMFLGFWSFNLRPPKMTVFVATWPRDCLPGPSHPSCSIRFVPCPGCLSFFRGEASFWIKCLGGWRMLDVHGWKRIRDFCLLEISFTRQSLAFCHYQRLSEPFVALLIPVGSFCGFTSETEDLSIQDAQNAWHVCHISSMILLGN